MKGSPVFSDEEKEEIYKPIPSFFEDGVVREVVILDKNKITKTSKDGKEYTQVEWTLADAKTGEKYTQKYGFELTNAFREHKDVMKFETSVFKITPVKIGEYNGYPTLGFEIEYIGEEGSTPAEEDAF